MRLLYRAVQSITVLFFITIIIFILPRLGSGDPAILLAGDMATEDQLQALREQMGLHHSLGTQYFEWIAALLKGNFGLSLLSHEPVIVLLASRIEPTVQLALYTLLLSCSIGIPMGIFTAQHQHSIYDKGLRLLSTLAFSIPVYVIGMLLTWLFSNYLPLLPVQGYAHLTEGTGESLWHLTLPCLTLTIVYTPLIARMTRSNILEQLQKDYIRTAYAKGASRSRILYLHALPNAAIPILTLIGFILTLLLAGVVVTESLFKIPGIGGLIVDAILARDYPLIQSLLLIVAILYTFLFLFLDMLYAWYDPRIRY